MKRRKKLSLIDAISRFKWFIGKNKHVDWFNNALKAKLIHDEVVAIDGLRMPKNSALEGLLINIYKGQFCSYNSTP
jgi:hypothetical protein